MLQSYRQNIEALVAYFHSRQYLPYTRLKEILNDAFGIPINEVGIVTGNQICTVFDK